MHADLVEALRDASLEAGVRPAILTVTHHPADHPVLAAFTDGAYQSAVLAAKSNG
jgi:23S rRNA G2069 N7-methylase RlmK/C1962 C5-methylase RlmI